MVKKKPKAHYARGSGKDNGPFGIKQGKWSGLEHTRLESPLDSTNYGTFSELHPKKPKRIENRRLKKPLIAI